MRAQQEQRSTGGAQGLLPAGFEELKGALYGLLDERLDHMIDTVPQALLALVELVTRSPRMTGAPGSSAPRPASTRVTQQQADAPCAACSGWSRAMTSCTRSTALPPCSAPARASQAPPRA
jgi:hypothetical protein